MINELAKQVHENAKKKGFFDSPKNTGEMLALIHAEVSEALEADRANKYCELDSDRVYMLFCWPDNESFKDEYAFTIKHTFEEEMADIVIRVMDMCAYKNIDLEAHIKAKMRYNSLREYKHGKKY